VREERVWMVDSKRDVEQDFAGRDTLRPAARSVDMESHLLVARTTKALLLGTFSDRTTDLRGAVRSGS
jgi:hypothetical protein